jgi:hypothetical protein
LKLLEEREIENCANEANVNVDKMENAPRIQERRVLVKPAAAGRMENARTKPRGIDNPNKDF